MPVWAIIIGIMGVVALLMGIGMSRAEPPPRRPSISRPVRRPAQPALPPYAPIAVRRLRARAVRRA